MVKPFKAMEYYEDAIRNLKNAKSEQVASALLINTAEKLQNGISQQWINQFLYDPDLREKGRHQVVKYLSDAATIRNDDFVVGKFLCHVRWLSGRVHKIVHCSYERDFSM